jgi:hypothetical protein
MIKIGIVGSRRRDTELDKRAIEHALFKVIASCWLTFDEFKSKRDSEIMLVSGGCPKGADRFAEIIAKEYMFPITIHYPDKSKLDKILSITNPIQAYAQINFARNKLIAFDSDYLIACVAEDRKGGTENTIKHFKELGKEKNLILV